MNHAQHGGGRLRRAIVILFAVLAALTAVPVASAAAGAGLPSCTSPSHSVNGEGSGIMLGTYNLKVAPFSHCGNVMSVPQGTEIYYLCFFYNSYNNWWVYGRVKGTSTYGWMSWDNLRDTGLDDNGDGYYDDRDC